MRIHLSHPLAVGPVNIPVIVAVANLLRYKRAYAEETPASSTTPPPAQRTLGPLLTSFQPREFIADRIVFRRNVLKRMGPGFRSRPPAANAPEAAFLEGADIDCTRFLTESRLEPRVTSC